MDILQLFSQLNQKDTLDQLSKNTNADANSIQKVIEMGLPTLIQAMGNNAKSAEGAKSLSKALNDHKDDPVNHLQGFLKQIDRNEGAKILKHVLGTKTTDVESKIASSSGLQVNQVDSILSQIAPMLLGVLAQEKKKKDVDASGLATMLPMLTGLLNAKSKNTDMMSIAKSLLDRDSDGDMMDDVGDLVKGFFGKK